MEWLNYHHLYYFWMVCKEGGYSKAAQKLRISQSAVSHQVALLEDFLGEKLMSRGPRGFTLTEAGQVALAEAESIFRQGEDLVQYFHSGRMKASFRVGALGGLSKNLQLKILYPLIKDPKLELTLEVGDPHTLLDKLNQYKLDAILSNVPFSSSEAYPLTQREIDAEPVCLVGKKRIRFRDIGHFIQEMNIGVFVPSKGSPVTSAILDRLASTYPSLKIRGFVDDIALLRLLALETDSLVVVPKIGVLRELKNKSLHVIHEFKNVWQSYYLVYKQRGKQHPALKFLGVS